MRKRTKKVSKINKFVRDNSQIENLNQFQSKIPDCSTFKIAEERLSLKLWDASQLESLKHMQNAWKLEHSFELPALGENLPKKIDRAASSKFKLWSSGLEVSLQSGAWRSEPEVRSLKFQTCSPEIEVQSELKIFGKRSDFSKA